MSDQTDNLINLLTTFGLSTEESEIYLHLLQKGHKTALAISRDIHMGRTKVYRILDKLYDKKLVYRKLDDMGFKFGANSYQQLELLVMQKEQELQTLKKATPMILQQLQLLTGGEEDHSQVLYYTGQQGLEQVTWNSTKAKGDFYSYEMYDVMDAFLDPKFAEKVRQEFVNNKIHIWQFTNHTKIEPYTKIEELPLHYWQCRYLDPKELQIHFEVLIYNNVYTMYSFENNDVFCVEIYNDRLAKMQKQLFQFIWSRAQKMKILNGRGEAVVESLPKD